MARTIAGKTNYPRLWQDWVNKFNSEGKSEDDIETVADYANNLATLANSYDMELGDFSVRGNWGLYQGKPVIIDAGFNTNVKDRYYK